jgi:F-type H+-transporting ATPase subunit a
MGMVSKSLKSLLVTGFSVFLLGFCSTAFAQDTAQNKAAGTQFEPGKVLMEHILDAHEFHFLTVGEQEVVLPLPIIIYSPEKGVDAFMSSRFEHGKSSYDGYKLDDGKIVAEDGSKLYDLSITRNVAQMFLGLIVLVWLLIAVAKKYTKNGAMKAPSGFQNAVEPVITFIRDEVGKSNLGKKYEKYMPYLLTVFFFILINNLFGLVPGSANVTGNIAFTVVLGVISFFVIIFNTNGHFWKHIFNPPAPGFVKPILVIVEFLGIFTKPIALIIRLFANMVAGHMIITCLIFLIFIFGTLSVGAGYGFSPVSLAFAIFIYLIEILVAFIQAFIFTNLTAVFISQAFEGGHDDGHGHGDEAIYM